MKKLNDLTLILLYICFGAGILYLGVLFWYVFAQLPKLDANTSHYIYMTLWGCGAVCMLVIVYTLIRMMKTLKADPFIMENVRYLKRMGVTALIMVVFTLLAFFISYTMTLLIIAMIELMCALFALVLRGVFEKAVEYRRENALTI